MSNSIHLNGALMVTVLPDGPHSNEATALMTVRGKDHDLTEADARGLARRFEEVAGILRQQNRRCVIPKPWTPEED